VENDSQYFITVELGRLVCFVYIHSTIHLCPAEEHYIIQTCTAHPSITTEIKYFPFLLPFHFPFLDQGNVLTRVNTMAYAYFSYSLP